MKEKETKSERAIRLAKKWLKTYNKISGSNLEISQSNSRKKSKKFGLKKLRHINELKTKDDKLKKRKSGVKKGRNKDRVSS